MSEVRPFYHQEAALLQGLVAARSLPVALRDRAQMVLDAHAGCPRHEIARRLGYASDCVRQWLDRFQAAGVLGLFDQPRPGAPRRLSVAAALRLTETAVTPPAQLGLPFTSWSLAKLQRYLAEQYDLQVSRETIRQVLARQGLSWQQARSWQDSPDPEFAAKRDAIIPLYTTPPPDALILCVDQKGPIQLRHHAGGGYAPKGRAARRPSTYVRHGTVYVLGALNPHTGQVWCRAFTHYNRWTVLLFLAWLFRQLALPPTQTVHLIWDNHKAHGAAVVRAWLEQRYPGQVQLRFTPSKAAWLNLLEAWWTIFARDVLRGGHWETKAAFRTQLGAYLVYYNAQPTPFVWGKTRPRRLFRAGPLRKGPLRGRAPAGNLNARFLYQLAVGCCNSWTTH